MFSRSGRYLAATVCVLALGVTGCESDESSTDTPGLVTIVDSDSWVAIEPTQCLTNPWEEDWLTSNGHDYQDYPKDYSTPGLDPGEVTIIKDYYRRLGVVVSNTATAPRYEVVCLACSCPEGHTMFLHVRSDDVDTMLGLGYRVESPPWWSAD